MKKILLPLALIMSSITWSFAQVSFIVLGPDDIIGGYELQYAPEGSGSAEWGVADLALAANRVVDTLALVDDGSAADSLGCGVLPIGSLTSKIAVVYRGICQFGTKALRAQTAGALAVIIINNVSGPPLGMLSGDDGDEVTIPVIMVSQATGVILRNKIDLGIPINALIGNQIGYYVNDLGFTKKNTLVAEAASNLALVSQNANEFAVNTGAWIFNYGQNDQTGVTLKVEVKLGATVLYTQTSQAASIDSGDSLYVSGGVYSAATYASGNYSIDYSIISANEDYNSNNTASRPFKIGDKFSIANLNDSGSFVTTAASQASGSVVGSELKMCIVFKDPNASRLDANGLSFFTTTRTGVSLIDEPVFITAEKWDDEFTGISDPAFDIQLLEEVASGVYDYAENLRGITVSANFDDPFIMEDNQRYLFCVTSFDSSKFIGTDSDVNYDVNESPLGSDQPVQMLYTGAWTIGFTDTYPAIILNTTPSVNALNEVAENKIISYPNPANDFITIPLEGFTGKGTLSITDNVGKLVLNENVTMGGSLRVNISNMSNGLYNFSILSNDGKKSSFKVMVSK